MVRDDVHRHVKGDTCLPFGVRRGCVIRGVRGEASGDPPELLRLLTPNGSGAEAGFKEVCDLPGSALVKRWG